MFDPYRENHKYIPSECDELRLHKNLQCLHLHPRSQSHSAERRVRRARAKASPAPPPGSHDKDTTHIAQLQVDGALLFERVTNTLKLLGDQYLARVYRLAPQRFHLEAWDASILRKLEALESIYGKMSDRATTRRMEVLEWIIIVLITISIAVSFFPMGGH
ncbi:MAG: hypothetical protein Q8N00_01995 [Nitrospirota bacterium]|nr:hypothetical protein [Nitrospirota bacterium]MDP3597287.1 hypothetical protein [Nitrospirota bacterium]